MKLSKVLSLVLAVVMLFGMQTFAFTDVADTASYAEAVQVLSALDIINGYEDGTFKPEGKITRAEYSAIVCRILDMGDAGANQVGGYFTDVTADHWASGYIATASQLGIVNGMGDGTFAPEAEVTYEQSVAMLVRALGYERKAQSMGGYPTGYMMIANQESITVGTANTAGGAARSTVARLTYNALTVPMMDQTSWGTDEKFEPIATQSLLWTKLDAVKADATFSTIPVGSDVEDVTLNITSNTVDKVAKANNYSYNGNVKINGVDLVGLQGLMATVIIDKSDETEPKLVTVVSKAGKNVEITVNPVMMKDVNVGDGYVEYYKTNDDDRTTKIKVPTTGVITYKNLETATYASAVVAGGNTGDVAYRFVDTDNNGTYETVFVDHEEVFVVGSVNTNSNKIFRSTDSNALTTFTGASLTLDPENENLAWSIVDAEGNAMDIEDIEAGDVVAVKTSNVNSVTFYDITVSNETVEGVITEAYAETAKVNGTTLNMFKIGDADYMLLDNSAMAPGDTITAKVYGNKVVSYTVAEGVTNFGMVIAANRAEDFGVTYQLQVLTQKGELATLNFAEKVNGATPSYGTTAALQTAFPKGDIIAYELNKDGEIKAIDVETGYNTATANVLTQNVDKMATGTDVYKPTSEKLGSYYITDSTVFFATETAKASITKDNVAMASRDILAEDTNYTFSVVYNSDKEAEVVVLIQVSNQIDCNSYPIAITKTATVTVEGETRTKLFGYVNGEETEIIVAENADATVTGLTVGDIALFTTNAAGEIVKAYTLADRDASDNYVVKNNAYNAVIGAGSGAEDDDKAAIGYTPVTLVTAEQTVNSAATAQTAAGAVMTSGTAVTAAADGQFKGFGAAGKAYKVQGNLLRLLSDADYAASFDGTAVRDYTATTDEDRINDYSVNASAVAYLYNAKTKKIEVTTLLDAETDYTTMDYQHGDQMDNDDLVYVYNYDGETKLVLIVDVNGDN